MLSETATKTVLSKQYKCILHHLSKQLHTCHHTQSIILKRSFTLLHQMQCIIFVKPFLTSFIQTVMTHLLS